MHKFRKITLVAGGILAGVPVFAEGAGAVDASLLSSYITTGQTQVVTLLTAGAAIVGAFYVWGLIKKALNRSK